MCPENHVSRARGTHREPSGDGFKRSQTSSYAYGGRKRCREPIPIAYDTTHQLLSDGTTTYSYDANGNPTMSGYATGSDNQITTDGTCTYTYDNVGDIVEKSKGSSLETWYYTYDTLNRLVSIEQTTNGTTAEYTVTYTYDVYGNLMKEQQWQTGGSVTTTYSVYDQGQVWADLNSSVSVTTRYIWGGPGSSQLYARVDVGVGLRQVSQDALGSVRDVWDATGVLDHVNYTVFGLITSETNAALGGYILFDGLREDRTSGTVMTPWRTLLTSLQRWMQPDPSGFGGGDGNLYRDCSNDPTNEVDQTGMQPAGGDVGAAIGGFVGNLLGDIIRAEGEHTLQFVPVPNFPKAAGGQSSFSFPGSFDIQPEPHYDGFVLQHVTRMWRQPGRDWHIAGKGDYWEVFPVKSKYQAFDGKWILDSLAWGPINPATGQIYEWRDTWYYRYFKTDLRDRFFGHSGDKAVEAAINLALANKDKYGTCNIWDMFEFPGDEEPIAQGGAVAQVGEAYYVSGLDWQQLPGVAEGLWPVGNPATLAGSLPSRYDKTAKVEDDLHTFFEAHPFNFSAVAWHVVNAPVGGAVQGWPGMTNPLPEGDAESIEKGANTLVSKVLNTKIGFPRFAK